MKKTHYLIFIGIFLAVFAYASIAQNITLNRQIKRLQLENHYLANDYDIYELESDYPELYAN